MENSLSNINSNSWKIALAIAIVPKMAIAIAVSILLLMSGMYYRVGSKKVNLIVATCWSRPMWEMVIECLLNTF